MFTCLTESQRHRQHAHDHGEGPQRWRGQPTDFESVAFVDAGGVSDRLSEMRLVAGVGGGVRWKSPVGPVQADLAWGVKPRKLRLHLSVGFVF